MSRGHVRILLGTLMMSWAAHASASDRPEINPCVYYLKTAEHHLKSLPAYLTGLRIQLFHGQQRRDGSAVLTGSGYELSGLSHTDLDRLQANQMHVIDLNVFQARVRRQAGKPLLKNYEHFSMTNYTPMYRAVGIYLPTFLTGEDGRLYHFGYGDIAVLLGDTLIGYLKKGQPGTEFRSTRAPEVDEGGR